MLFRRGRRTENGEDLGDADARARTRARACECVLHRARARVCEPQRVYREYHRDCALRRGPGLFIEEFRDRHTAPRDPTSRIFSSERSLNILHIYVCVCTAGKVDVAAGTLIARVSSRRCCLRRCCSHRRFNSQSTSDFL